MAYVLSNGRDYLAFSADTSPDEPNKFANLRTYLDSKAYQLGQDFASSQHTLDELGPNLFLVGMPYRVKFGQGLARGHLTYGSVGNNSLLIWIYKPVLKRILQLSVALSTRQILLIQY